MARIRSIKPEMPHDKKLASVSRDARLTFIYIWTLADDDGFFRAEPRQLLGELYPHEPVVSLRRLAQWLTELVRIGVIRWRKTKDGARVGEVVNWKKHQLINHPGKSFLKNQLVPFTGESLETLQKDSGDPPKMSGGESMSLESMSLESTSYTSDFEEAWKAYPKRRGGNSKRQAYRHWLARIAEGVSPETMIAGTRRYAAELREAGKLDTPYVKLGATFYGRDRHFEYETPVTPIAKPPTTKMVAEHDGVRLRLVEVPLSDPRPAA